MSESDTTSSSERVKGDEYVLKGKSGKSQRRGRERYFC